MSVIDEVKQRLDIVEVAGQYTALTKAGRNFQGICPFHSEKHASFFVFPEQQSWHCFGACGTGGDVFSLIMKKEGIEFGEALRRCAEKVGVTIPSRAGQAADKEKNERLYQANEAAADYFHRLLLDSPAAEKTRAYVSKRGISAQSINTFRLGYSPSGREELKKHLTERGFSQEELISTGLLIKTEEGNTIDRFYNRLMFPICDIKSRTVGFGARALDNTQQPKYTNSPDTPLFHKSSLLYAVDLAKDAIRQQELAVIVEGYMDVIAAHDNSFGNVIASMGTSITEKQVLTLKKLTKNIVLALDADTAGEEAAMRGIVFANNLGAEVRVAVLPAGRDPDDVIRQSKEDWQQLTGDAIPIMDYVFDRITAGLDLNTPRDKSMVVDKLEPFISQMKDLVRQSHYFQKLAKLVDITPNQLQIIFENKAVERNRIKSFARQRTATATSSRNSLLSNPREEYCLAMLLQYPELKRLSDNILPEYFADSENREIFNAYRQSEDIASLKDGLDSTMWGHFDSLIARDLLDNRKEERLSDCILRLKEEHLRRLERKREAVLASEAALKGSGAELGTLEEQGTEGSSQLMDIFVERAKGRHKQRRN